jgi:hypothetical protein
MLQHLHRGQPHLRREEIRQTRDKKRYIHARDSSGLHAETRSGRHGPLSS